VFDAKADKAYWLHVQEYVNLRPNSVNPDQEMVNVHIPVSNKLTVKSVEAFRSRSLQIVDNLRNQGGLSDVRQKPK